MNQQMNSPVATRVQCAICGAYTYKDRAEMTVGNSFECASCRNKIRLCQCASCGKKFAVCYEREKTGEFTVGCSICGKLMNMNIPAMRTAVLKNETTRRIQTVAEKNISPDAPVAAPKIIVQEKTSGRPAVSIKQTLRDAVPSAPVAGRMLFFIVWPLVIVPLSAVCGLIKKSVNHASAGPGSFVSGAAELMLVSTSIFLYLLIARAVFAKRVGFRYPMQVLLFSLAMPLALRLFLDMFYSVPNITPVLFFAVIFPLYAVIAGCFFVTLLVISRYPFADREAGILSTVRSFISMPGTGLVMLALSVSAAALSGVFFQTAFKLIMKISRFLDLSTGGDVVSTSFASLWTPYRILVAIGAQGASLPMALAALIVWSLLFTMMLSVTGYASCRITARYAR